MELSLSAFLSPIIAAIAAGNCCILKPSEIAENTMKAMSKIINENFRPNICMYMKEELMKPQNF
jgi:aldehyde dehydrogenase (NAD+)